MLQNQELPITKDSQVEVCSEEEGFVGAWFRAILEECPTKSRRKKLLVRYTTLLEDDGSTPLTETVQQNFIRPVPPEDLNNGIVFIEGSVVDADLKDGWWHGVVIKILEDDQFLVCFDTPPDIIQFNRNQLRPHLDWTGSEWVRPENKELSKSLFSSGTMVEVSREINKMEAAWVPAIVIKEVEVVDEKKLIVKSCNKSLTFKADEVNTPPFTVDVCNVRPIPPPSVVEEYNLLDRVDAFCGWAWRRCLVRGILSDNRYTVSFVATKEESVFKHSDLRPSKEWEDGVWHQRLKRKLEKETPSKKRPKKLKVIRSCAGGSANISSSKRFRKPPVHAEATEGETELHDTVAVKESGHQMPDSCIMKLVSLFPEKEDAAPESSVINGRPLREEEEEAETQPLTSMRMINILKIDSTGEKTPEEHNKKGNSHKRKRKQNLKEAVGNGSAEALIADTSDNDEPLSTWILGGKSSNDANHSKLSPEGTSPKAVKDSARASEDTTMVLPFVKRSPIWKTLESMETFKTAKQSPHFIPLLDTREELREGLAVGEMVNFSNLLERVSNLQLHTPKTTFEGLKECFYELHKYGFDVTEPISRINLLVSLIDENVSEEDKLKEIEKGKTEEVSKVQKVEEDFRDVERKILELQNLKADLKEKKDASEKKIAHMQLCAEDVDKKLQQVEFEFQKIVSASW